MELNVLRGRRLVIGIICVFLGVPLLTSIFNILSDGFNKIGTKVVVDFIFNYLLCFFIYKGHNWAKWIIVVLTLIGALIGLLGSLLGTYIGVAMGPFSNINWLAAIVVFIISIIYGTVGVLLISSKSIKSFMEFQKSSNI